MNKNEMIKELLHIICFHCAEDKPCSEICDECLANTIYNAGFRKVGNK